MKTTIYAAAGSSRNFRWRIGANTVFLPLMKKSLRIVAFVLLAVTLGIWAGLGANLGWTKTKIPIEHIDPVTEIKYVEWQSGFQPGLELLALGVGGCALVFLASFAFRTASKSNQPIAQIS